MLNIEFKYENITLQSSINLDLSVYNVSRRLVCTILRQRDIAAAIS